MRRTFCWSAIVVLLSGLFVSTRAQSDARSLEIVARVEAGNVFYEIVGTGFGPGERVRVKLRNAEAGALMVLRSESSTSGSWRAVFGRDASGTFYPVAGGTWRVRAHAQGGGARAAFTAPEDDAVAEWGGDHVQLRVFETGAALEYDCAHGSIDEPLVIDGDGRFALSGVHVFEHGGPVEEGEMPDAHPARYAGQIVGDTMTLTLSVADRGVDVTFSLVRGEPGSILRCL